ncbi:MAG: SpoIID/LytB domain-containing protein [Ignavibacteriales bacterium]|nr:SpoIID/LytB domain-containing protein [Ignavibacteriales bacterium]
MYNGFEEKLDEGKTLTIRSQAGKVTVTVGETVHNSSIIKLRPVNSDEYLYLKKKSYRGEIWFTAQNAKTLIINYLDLEDYVLGVVPLEIGLKNEYFFQALKCAAVTARTFAINRMLEKRANFDVTDGVKDQAYGGIDVETGIDSRAVFETEGMILTWQKKPALIFYHANCGGHTEDIANVFGPVNHPYLKGVKDGDPPYCEKSPSFKWKESFSAFEIIRYLADAGLIKSKNFVLEGMEIKARHTSGRAKELFVYLKDEKPIKIAGSRIRDVIKSKKDNSILRSSNFEIEVIKQEGVTQKIILTGLGNGHGVGMCQWGAMNQSRAGRSYEEILDHYFPQTEITRVYGN